MRFAVLTLLAAWCAAAAADEIEHSVAADTGLATWQTETRGIQVRLTQITPDQARAFYQARGFSPAVAERYAAECVFMTVVRNVGDAPIEHRIGDWRYTRGDGPERAIRDRVEWDRLWRKLGVADAARIAFTWAQIPDAQTFAPGDWNQGMTSYHVPHGERFDLSFVWHAGGKRHAGELKNVRCADERK